MAGRGSNRTEICDLGTLVMNKWCTLGGTGIIPPDIIPSGQNPPRNCHPGQNPPSESCKVDRIPPHTHIFLLDFYLWFTGAIHKEWSHFKASHIKCQGVPWKPLEPPLADNTINGLWDPVMCWKNSRRQRQLKGTLYCAGLVHVVVTEN